MNRHRCMKTIICCALYFFILSMPGWSESQSQQAGQASFTAAGSGANLGITSLLAEEFMRSHPQITITIPGSIGTQGAVAAVGDGAIALGLISRPLKDEEKAKGLVEKPYARVAMVFAANQTVSDSDISTEDVFAILRGSKTHWQDGKEIVVHVREKFDSGFQILGKAIAGFNDVYWESLDAKRWTVAYTDQDANRMLATTPYAFGVTDHGMIATEHLPIKVLRFNGALPGIATLKDGTYPLTRQLSFIYREDKITKEVIEFMDFVFSANGGRILEKHNYLPLP